MNSPVMKRTQNVIVLTLLGIALYIASFGPVGYAHVRFGLFNDSFFTTFYSPLSLIPSGEPLLKSYLEFWLGSGDCGTGKGG